MKLAIISQQWIDDSACSNTRSARRNDVRTFNEYFGDIEFEELTRGCIEAFIEHRLQWESAATVSRRVSSLKALCNYIADFNPTWVNPARRVRGPVFSSPEPMVFAPEQEAKFLEFAYSWGTTPFLRARNGIVCELMLRTGIRLNEAVSLRESNISRDWQWLENLRCKGRKIRAVYLAPVAHQLRMYLPLRHTHLRELRGELDFYEFPLFPAALSSDCVNVSVIREAVSAAGQRIGIRGCHPHMLRHTYAHRLYDKTKDLRLVAQALGHSSVETTARYTTRTRTEFAGAIHGAFAVGHGTSALGTESSVVEGGTRFVSEFDSSNGRPVERERANSRSDLEKRSLQRKMVEVFGPAHQHVLRVQGAATSLQAGIQGQRPDHDDEADDASDSVDM